MMIYEAVSSIVAAYKKLAAADQEGKREAAADLVAACDRALKLELAPEDRLKVLWVKTQGEVFFKK